jgi:putative ATP-binding cassette transporter
MNRLIYESIEDRISALQVKITDHVRKTDLQTLEQIGPGRIYTALTADIRTISDGSDTIMVCTQGAFRTVMIYISLGFPYFPMTLMMLFLTGIGGLFYGITQSVMTKLFDSIRDQERKLFDVLGGLLKGFKELKLSNKKNDHFYHEGFRACTSEMQEIRLRFIRCYINNHTMINSLWQIALLGITLLLPFMGISSKALLIGIALMLTLPVQQVIERYSGFHQTYMSIRQLYAFENRMTGLSQEPAEILSPEFFEEIRYEQFAFTYNVPNGRAFSVGPLNLSFIPGEIVFITGGNGSGKSTLLKLLTGLYPPDTGQFFFDGNTGDIRLYREIFSVIFSEFHLFDRLYGMEEVDEARLGELLKLFHLEKKVRWADGKFSTLDLSTGQKKRLSLVVTMMEDKPVYIFDEWAADQDPQFRKYFYMTLLPEFKAQGKTVIAVTHDDRYFHVADRVIRMEYGQII